jgi:CTP:molybdopterin cytidylyltransferase MocA
MTADDRRPTTAAVLLAGGRISGELARRSRVEIKALIDFGGETLLDRAVRAARGAGVERVVVVGPEETAVHGEAAHVREGSGGIENLFLGLEELSRSGLPERLLILATDLPFVTAEAVSALLDAASLEAGVVVPVLTREEFAAGYPEAPAVYVRLADGQFTAASAFVVDPGILSPMRPRLESAFAARKSQLGMAALFGPLATLKFLAGRLRSEDVVRRANRQLGINGCALRGCPPELAFDIDTLEEYEYALRRSPALPKASR